MKKINVIILLSSISFAFSCKEISLSNSLKEQNIFGKVKTVSTYNYRASKNQDSAGNYVKDTLVSKVGSSYDNYGNELERTKYNSNEIIQTVFQYSYDDNHRIIKTKTKESTESLHTIHNYEYSGNEQIENEYNKDGVLILKNTYKYNDQGQKIEKMVFNAQGESKNEKYIYLYDAKGNMIEIDKYINTEIVDKSFYQYDGYGNWKRIFFSELDFIGYNSIEKYEKSLAENPNTPPPPPPSPPIYEVPDFNYFQFDKNNNWQKSVQHNGTIFIVERKIIYY